MTTEQEVITKLKEVVDPHTKQNVWDMGLISDIRIEQDKVSLVFRPSASFCPLGQQLAVAIKKKLKGISKDIDLKVTGYIKEKELNEYLKTC